jgi:hypothetical protein
MKEFTASPCYDRAVPAARTLAAVIALGACLALAQAPLRSFEIQIAERRVPPEQRELRWSADEPLVLHLHGYDIETRVVAIHAEGSNHRHRALLYVEIYPR